jgi:hypothetical protein
LAVGFVVRIGFEIFARDLSDTNDGRELEPWVLVPARAVVRVFVRNPELKTCLELVSRFTWERSPFCWFVGETGDQWSGSVAGTPIIISGIAPKVASICVGERK